MENKSTNFDRIEAYLLGHMPADEARAFEQAFQQDKDLAQEVERQRLEHRAMELLHQEDLRANMQRWKAEDEDSATTAQPGSKVVSGNFGRSTIFRLAAAAAVTLLVGFFAREFFMSGISNEAMAMAEFGNSTAVFRGNDTDPLAVVYQALSKKEYRTALTLLEQVHADYQPATVLNLRGECHFYQKEYPQAVAVYQQLIASNPTDGDLREKAAWRLLLSLLAQGGNKAEVLRLLDKVIADKGQFEEEAREMKDKIK